MRRIGVALVVGALIMAACLSPSEPEIDATTTSATLAVIEPTTTTASPAGSAEEKPYGGEVRILAFLPHTMNPYLDGLGVFPDQLVSVAPAILVGATHLSSETGERLPGVLARVPGVENGGIEVHPDDSVAVTYEIDPDAVWEDGTPLSGHDFEFTYRQVIEHAGELAIDNLELYERIDPESVIASDKRFIFRLDAFDANLHSLFPVVVPKHQVEGTDFLEDWNEAPWLSAGPFRFIELVPDSHLVLERNDRYWRTDLETGQQLPYLDRVLIGQFLPETVSVIEDREVRDLVSRAELGDEAAWDEIDGLPDDRRAEFDAWGATALDSRYARGIVDSYWSVPQGEAAIEAIAVDGRSGAAVLVLKQSGPELFAFQFGDWRRRANSESLVEHLEFRQAIAYAIDPDAIAAEVYGSLMSALEPYAGPLPNFRIDSIVGVASPSLSRRPWAAYPHDPERARSLINWLCAELARDCSEDPPRLVFVHTDNPIRAAAVEQMASDLAEIGVVVETRTGPNILPLILNEPWEAALFGWVLAPGLAGVADVLGTASPDSLPSEGGGNWYHWGTPAIREVVDDPATVAIESNHNQGPSSASGPLVERYRQLVETMESATHPAILEAAVLEAEQILADELVFLPMYQRHIVHVWNPAIGGYAHRSSHLPEAWNIAEWYRTDL